MFLNPKIYRSSFINKLILHTITLSWHLPHSQAIDFLNKIQLFLNSVL